MKTKANQARIYRDLESLLEICIEIVERLPKSVSYRTLGDKLITNLLESMDYVVMAFRSDTPESKIQCIAGIELNVTSAHTILSVLLRKRKISGGQFGQLADTIDAVTKQYIGWSNSQQSRQRQQ